MAETSVLKIPFLLVGVYCDHLVLTSPNPPPPEEEQRKYGERTKAFAERGPLTLARAMPFWKYLVYLLWALEVITILSTITGHQDWVSILIDSSATSKIRITPTFVVGFIIRTAGALLRYDAYRQLGRQFTFQLAIRKDHKLVTSGAYSIVRHPGYTGAQMVFIGTTLCGMGPGSFYTEARMWWTAIGVVYGVIYLALPAYMVLAGWPRLRQEDEMLHTMFKEQWEAWASKTRYRLYPFIY